MFTSHEVKKQRAIHLEMASIAADFSKVSRLLTLVLLSWTALEANGAAEATCGECMANMAFCIDETRFYLCPNGEDPLKTTEHRCADDEVCTSAEDVCVKRDEAAADLIACHDDCNSCPSAAAAPNNRFACVSASQYALCTNNGAPSAITGSCPPGESCNVELYKQHGSICAPACVLDFFGYEATCRNEEVARTPAPTAATPAPNLDRLKELCLQRLPDPYEGYYYIGNSEDPECKTYILCERIANEMDFILLNCKSGFYDEDEAVCVDNKPESCNGSSLNADTDGPKAENPPAAKPESQKAEPAKVEPEKPKPTESKFKQLGPKISESEKEIKATKTET